MWIDQRAGGVVRVSVVPGSTAATVRSMARSGMGSAEVAFTTARFSAVSLQRVQDRITARMVAKSGIGTYASQASVDPRTNRVVVLVSPAAPAALMAATRAQYPEVDLAPSSSVWDSQSRDRSTGPMYGGAWISTSSRACTDGYSNAFVGTRRVTLTAGHCLSGRWYQGKGADGYLAGGVIRSGFAAGGSSYCDCEAIGTIAASKATSSVLTTNTDTYYYSRTATSSNYLVGTRLCLSGAQYGDAHGGANACGQIDSSSATISYSDGPITLRDAVTTSIVGTYAGDSGGPYGSGRTFMSLHAAGRLAYGMVVETALSKSSRIGGIGVSLRY